MHTAKLRGSDFEIIVNGRQQDHAEFFRGFTNTRRLGIVAPRRIDGVGAANLLMAYGTAFYDVYRAAGKAFSALADFFVFQSASPVGKLRHVRHLGPTTNGSTPEMMPLSGCMRSAIVE